MLKEALAAICSVVIAVIVFGNIAVKAGYSRWMGLAMVVPLVNVVLIVLFAFTTWPIETELFETRLAHANARASE